MIYNEIASNKRKSILLILVFFLIIVGLGWWVSFYFQENGGSIVFIAVIFATVMALFSYYKGDRVALAVARAQKIEKKDNPYLYNIVENLCITTGMPIPAIYIIPDSALNAFATGRDPQHSSLAVTAGLINALENEELQGVIAHELSHVKNFDIRVATIAIICVGIITLIADFTFRSMWFRGGRGRREGNGGPEQILMIVGFVFLLIAPLFARLMQLAVSRKREFLADASGALITRYPEGLARALEKIAGNEQPLASANRATAHLYIADPYKRDSFIQRASTLFSTHPPIAERIKRLRHIND